MKPAFLIAVTSLLFMFCRKIPGTTLPFEATPMAVPVIPGKVDEASGITDSRRNPGFLWINQDSGNPPELFLMSYQGMVMKKVHIKGVLNRDWEDIVLGPGPDTLVNYIYIAETGDNDEVYADYMIYRFPEPAASTDTVHAFEKIRFEYPDGAHDVEAILVDNITRDIVLITKQDSLSRIFTLPYPQSTTSTNIAVPAGEMKAGGFAAASLSTDGNEVLVKNYTNVYYWERHAGETIAQTLTKPPLSLGYELEPQGEAICFRNDNKGFYTLSEKPFFAGSVSLNFYKRRK